MEIYCLKCKSKKEVGDEYKEVLSKKNPKTGKKTKMAKALCPDCGTKMNKILGAA